eukprot:CAMPEP_0174838138 /NCGR_PEP_ID=MMETSP1114-20130205/7216_1 /TAXON_ID=312471 /ORGANISM="Neobodo designis, Strain CCAP 1951/1" /LENGTH=71 /DNA_ID=CAMNT_0016072233 /DNA_START=55 /DNA_END=266 /DNA_ORIENTATION=-
MYAQQRERAAASAGHGASMVTDSSTSHDSSAGATRECSSGLACVAASRGTAKCVAVATSPRVRNTTWVAGS